jgi:hypothetical protein
MVLSFAARAEGVVVQFEAIAAEVGEGDDMEELPRETAGVTACLL